jgi:hypothetical protein
MTTKRYELVTHTFKGGRFEGHGIDIDTLTELVTFKNILVETAKELWRRNHQKSKKLPRNFADSLRLQVSRIEAGSVCIPLEREIREEGQRHLPFKHRPDELDDAVDIVADAIDALAKNEPVPEACPKSVIPLFGKYGESLGHDERIEIKPARRKSPVKYTRTVRERFARLVQADYMDQIDVTGEIRAADLDGLNFTLKLPDSSKAAGRFSPAQEAIIIEALREHSTRQVRIQGRAEFSPDGRMKKIVAVTEIGIQPAGVVQYDSSATPVWQMAGEIAAEVPAKEWAALPKDLSKQLDHYLHGSPKGK